MDDPDVLALGADQANLWGADAIVDTGARITGGWRIVRSAGYGMGPYVVTASGNKT